MKKLFTFVTALMMAGASWAASETPQKWLREIVYNDTCRVLSYSDDGMLTSIFERSAKMDSLLWLYDYHRPNTYDGVPYIFQGTYFDPSSEYGSTIYFFNRKEPYFRESLMDADGRIVMEMNSNSYLWSRGYTFEYTYKDGRIVEMRGPENEMMKLSWTDDNLTSITFFYKGEETGSITCTYTELPAKGVCQAFNSPLMLLTDYYGIQSLGPLWHGYYGLLSRNLLDEMTINFSEKYINDHAIVWTYDDIDECFYSNMNRLDCDYYPVAERKSRKYSYETDADGYVTSMTVDEGGRKKEYAMHYVDARPDDQQTPDDYHTLLKDGKKWNYKVTCDHFTNGWISSVETFDYQEQINGDTLIDGRKYYILETFNPDKRLPHRRYWREEGRKVYCWDVEKKLDLLMYSFDATIGYRVLSTEPVYRDFIVTGKGTVNTQGNHLSFYQLRGYGVGIFSWIEGVGSTGLLSEAYGRSRIDTVRVRVQSCYEDGKCIFNAEDMQEGDFTDNLKESAPQLSARQSTHPSAFYDLQGRPLTTKPRRGIYVKDGKKVVVK